MKAHEIALSLYGEKEIKGQEDNPIIVQMFTDLGYDGKKLKDETAWCSAFINWCFLKVGLPYTGKLNARSWLNWGSSIGSGKPILGDVVVFWRESPQSWKGHVGFYITERHGWIYVLGGNQNNEVNIKGYPKKRLLDIRRMDLLV